MYCCVVSFNATMLTIYNINSQNIFSKYIVFHLHFFYASMVLYRCGKEQANKQNKCEVIKMYTIYEYQPAQNVLNNVGQSTDTNFKRAIIKATSRYRFDHHMFEIHLSGSIVKKVIDNRAIPEF